MLDGGYLIPPSENTKSTEIWDETWKRVDRFLPSLHREIFPDANLPTGAVPTETSKKNPARDKELTGKPEERKELPASVSN